MAVPACCRTARARGAVPTGRQSGRSTSANDPPAHVHRAADIERSWQSIFDRKQAAPLWRPSEVRQHLPPRTIGMATWVSGRPGRCLRLESFFAALLVCAALFLLVSFVVHAKPRRFTTHEGCHNLRRMLVTLHQTGQAVRMLEDHKPPHSGRN